MNGELTAEDLQGGPRRYASTFEERFWRKVTKTDTCWLWPNPRENGYGETYRNGRTVFAHRAAYVLAVGPIANGQQIDHLCRVRNCVRPDHLEAVSPQENNARGTSPSAQNLTKDQCPQGHPYDEANTYVDGRKRACRTCRNEASRRSRKRKVVTDRMSHGKVGTYSAGCRCDPCREAKRIKNRKERSQAAMVDRSDLPAVRDFAAAHDPRKPPAVCTCSSNLMSIHDCAVHGATLECSPGCRIHGQRGEPT